MTEVSLLTIIMALVLTDLRTFEMELPFEGKQKKSWHQRRLLEVIYNVPFK